MTHSTITNEDVKSSLPLSKTNPIALSATRG